jgi:NADH dehydrogenase
MSRTTLARDFRNINPAHTRVMLIEAGKRILASFEESLAERAMRDLEGMGVQVWTESLVTKVDARGVEVGGVEGGGERIEAATVLWAAGVQAAAIGATLPVQRDRQGRIHVGEDLSLPGHSEVFAAGDLAHAVDEEGRPYPGLAPVAIQQGRWLGDAILRDIAGKPRGRFHYIDKGQMATIGRRRAVVQTKSLRFDGFFAWWTWLLVHIYYLTGFRNRVLVLIQWAWSYLTFARGARLIVDKQWRLYGRDTQLVSGAAATQLPGVLAEPPADSVVAADSVEEPERPTIEVEGDVRISAAE